MHDGIIKYIEQFKHLQGEYNLEVGSLNVNGTIRNTVDIAIGVDMRPGKDVDQVCTGEELPDHFLPNEFDTVFSCETLEHVRNWREFLQGVWYVLKDDGHFICTLASKRKRRHAYPDDYWRLDPDHVKDIFRDQEIVDINPDLGVSFGFVVKKVAPLVGLETIKLLPVDKAVPEELL
jgi:SAM-dependent methyltransferase